MKTIYISDIRGNVINGRISGHIVPVARNYKEALCRDFDVKIAAGPAILQSFDKEDCLVLPYNVSSESLLDKLRTFANFTVLLWKARGNTIIIQHSTIITTFIAIILFYWWTSPLYMIQYNTDALNGGVKRLINKLVQFKLTGTLCPSDRIGKAYGGRYCKVPDYLYTGKRERTKSYSEREWDIAIVGGIYSSKGVVEAAQYLSGKNKKVYIAGRICEPELEKPLLEISASSRNIVMELGYITDERYIEIIRNSKFCMLNYRGTYFDRSSGVVLDSIYNGTPVLGTRCEALKVIEENRLGAVYDDIEELDLDKELSCSQFTSYINSVHTFLDDQDRNVQRLCSFLSGKTV